MRQISNYTLKKASEHVYYEAWMFYETIQSLVNTKDQALINVSLDAFAIHCRNLLDFLYPKTNTRPDDIIVSDYIDDSDLYENHRTPKSDLRFVIRKTDKQVAHLTYARNRYNSKTKPWPLISIGEKFHKTLSAFYDALSENRKSWPYFVMLKQMLNNIKVLGTLPK